jgi:hypothetical protein
MTQIADPAAGREELSLLGFDFPKPEPEGKAAGLSSCLVLPVARCTQKVPGGIPSAEEREINK